MRHLIFIAILAAASCLATSALASSSLPSECAEFQELGLKPAVKPPESPECVMSLGAAMGLPDSYLYIQSCKSEVDRFKYSTEKYLSCLRAFEAQSERDAVAAYNLAVTYFNNAARAR
jgi:hypothetical protein